MLTYSISTGVMQRDDGVRMGTGYSGQPECKNDPAACSIKNKGPIPPGLYTIEAPRDSEGHGPYVLPLTPDPSNEMHGRDAFLIHGDSVKHPGTASQGCIILGRAVREAVWETASASDRKLRVVE